MEITDFEVGQRMRSTRKAPIGEGVIELTYVGRWITSYVLNETRKGVQLNVMLNREIRLGILTPIN